MIFEKIKEYFSAHKVSRLEKGRFLDDVGVSYDRLIHGEYRYMDYSGKNKFNIPERTQEFFLYLESYCFSGKTWSYILNTLDIQSYRSAVDLCSGWAPKITLAFFYSRYTGVVYLFDQSMKSMGLLVKFMQLFRPEFIIKKCKKDFFNYSGEGFDFIVANHVIDDLVLEYFCRRRGISSKNIYKKEGYIKSLWDEILINSGFYDEVLEVLTHGITHLVSINGIICLAQYKSMVEGLLGLEESVEYNKNILLNITQKLEKSGSFIILPDIAKTAFGKKKTAFHAEECFVLKKIK